ncbi:hypothetical protein [Chitinophaga sp. Cy-1792]|uniref:hypothetical protein n=1 Tax=Chitinophaga sp. Cy-1792 TaxID=2608339 RepID=UPI0014242724|nr:hypothetical protein [Chitinophaga sp. Cy-1792]NIG56685.1 hypothetical protein [Chitinophaga sp. Cy-1792]
MGHSANYIIREHNKQTIYYNHWGGVDIAKDMLKGEKEFLKYVSSCTVKDQLVSFPWLEGIVIIDIDVRKLYFWEIEFTDTASVMEYYISQLANIWAGWEVIQLKNEMYDADKILQLNYFQQQEMMIFDEHISEQDIINDEEVGFVDTLVIIQESTGLYVTKLMFLLDQIIHYGEAIIPLLKNKPPIELPREGDGLDSRLIVIDVVNKRILVDDSLFGDWEDASALWPDYSIIRGRYGYIGILRKAGIMCEHLKMTEEEIKKSFSSFMSHNDDFDPTVFAAAIRAQHEDIRFNPDFFDRKMPD